MSDSTISQDAIVIERTFDAPQDFIWQLWTQPEHFKHWYGPTGFSIPVAEINLEVGGRRLVGMESPDGSMKLWLVGEFVEIVPTERLVFTESIADEHGNVVPPSTIGIDNYPDVTEITVLLEDLDGRTKMTMTHAGVPADSPGASGWKQAFVKMADYIETIK